ncbi:MAG TPA: hypothetical protein VFJ51_09050 [Nitrososphaeraceae archaeon]|nr:hypothetical protein [Nitrososphaeraceae archaeon]
MKKAIEHMWEYHAIKQEEMTSEMKVKIKACNISWFAANLRGVSV